LALWWTWPSRWAAPAQSEPIEVRDRRPAWARSFRPPPALPPVSREASRAQELGVLGPLDVDEEDFEEGFATIAGWVVDDAGRAVRLAFVALRCDSEHGPTARIGRAVDAGGWFEFVVPAPSLCTVKALRQDGALRALSQTETYLLDDDDYLELDLVLPSEPIGGVGISIGSHALGVEVLAVMPGTPAEALGLERGDVIVEVDGVAVSGADLDDFIRRGTGPAGTPVQFTVLPGGDPWDEPIVIEGSRQRLEEQPIR